MHGVAVGYQHGRQLTVGARRHPHGRLGGGDQARGRQPVGEAHDVGQCYEAQQKGRHYQYSVAQQPAGRLAHQLLNVVLLVELNIGGIGHILLLNKANLGS